MLDRTGIVLFRRDLRLKDNPALKHVRETCDAVVPIFVWNPSELEPWAPGAASRYWLHQSLCALDQSLRDLGSHLVVAQGDSTRTILEIARLTRASLICWNRRYEPRAIAADSELERELSAQEIEVTSFNGSLLVEPWEIKNKSGAPFRVFTPFWKTCLKSATIESPLNAPSVIPAPSSWPDSAVLEALQLEPSIDWAKGIRESWKFGEQGAWSALDTFVEEAVENYKDGRDRLGQHATSRLSPFLASGELSPRQIWHAVQQRISVDQGLEDGAEAFLRQLFWREFAYHLLYYEPHTTDEPLRPEFERFPWRDDREMLKQWQQGQTGYPIVDAGMRELWHTGFMHNRARMVVASFLVKDLMIHWREGAKWFWDTLVDADLANNTLGWQWTSGCGADAAPYFRVFNPIRQGERFDQAGAYVRRWVPELAPLPDKYIHRPWETPANVLKESSVVLGDTYPQLMVDHSKAREEALAAYELVRR